MNYRPVVLWSTAAWLLSVAAPAPCQLDPLLFLKGTRPRILIGLDLSSRMLRDTRGRYYDPVIFSKRGEAFEPALDVNDATTDRRYRRRYLGLGWYDPGSAIRATVLGIETVGDRDPGFLQFDELTLLGRARAALRRVIQRNGRSSRFGLVTTRQVAPRLDTTDWAVIATASPPAGAPTDTGVPGQWRAGIPRVDGPGADGPAGGVRVAADAATGNADLSRLLERRPGDTGGLLPAGFDTAATADAPLGRLMDDLRAEALRLVSADRSCCNTVVVIIAAGGDPALGEPALGEQGARFLDINGRRVPIYVIGLAVPPAEARQLQELAVRSGGRYLDIPAAALDRSPAGEPVPEVVSALNLAVQHGFATFADINVAPSPAQPTGRPSFFSTAPPVVGTVNLENAVGAEGRRLPDTRITGRTGEVIVQRSNVLFTAGFVLPGFLGRLNASRVYRPVPDERQVTGYRFTADGTSLWSAAVPPAPQRNLYTVLPGTGLIPFRSSNADLLRPFLGVPDPAAFVDAVRSMPLGAIVNSTPALLEPPSMPLADASYATFVEAHRNRRGLVFVGADDGMMHAFDARTGIEVWAVIPFNLLPRLRLLQEGAAVDDFAYLVDGSPRLSDVKVAEAWRTLMVFGEGPGGTFYQAFDVTLDGMADTVRADSDDIGALLAWFSSAGRLPFVWSFPRYEQFDASLGTSGDLRASATDAEKSVGETWSTPAVGRVAGPAGPFAVIVGSGRFPRSREREVQRGAVRAGTRMYMLDVASGALLDSRDVGNDGIGEDQDDCSSDSCARLKNALQGDPVIAGAGNGTGIISRVYQGDLDGRLWRFDLRGGPEPPGFLGTPRLLFGAGAEQPIFGSVALLAGGAGQSYIFFGTGSDLLPRLGIVSGHRLFGISDSGEGVSRLFERVLRSAGTDDVDEGVAGAPVMGGSVVFFTTNSVRPGNGCESPEASLYALTLGGGAAYDANGDGRRDDRDPPVVSRVRAGRATAPVVADRHLFVATGDRVQVFGDPEGFDAGPGFLGIRIISWHEVR